MSTQAKKLRWNNGSNAGMPIQVDSAITDGTGRNISVDCVRHAEIILTINTATRPVYTIAFTTLEEQFGSASDGTDTAPRIPRQVEIYDSSGNQIFTDVKIDDSETGETAKMIVITPIVSGTQVWTVRVTAW